MSSLVPFDPFAELQALQKQFFGGEALTSPTLQLPTTDIYTRDDKELIVEAHLPHFEEKDIDISVDKGTLTISAERHEKDEDKGKKYVVRESASSFYRRIRLPERADEEAVSAHMENGVLRVTVGFKELPAPKKITIKQGKSAK